MSNRPGGRQNKRSNKGKERAIPPAALHNKKEAPNNKKEIQRERAAQERAFQKVYISGIQGHQTLATGIAYWFRGHFLYGPTGNPIEPILHCKNPSLNLRGFAHEFAPQYDPNGPELVAESSIAALSTSLQHLLLTKKEEKDQMEREYKENKARQLIEEEQTSATSSGSGASYVLELPSIRQTDFDSSPDLSHAGPSSAPPSQQRMTPQTYLRGSLPSALQYGEMTGFSSRAASPTSPLILPPARPQSTPSASLLAPTRPTPLLRGIASESFTPHDRALFLANSAPGSRLASTTTTPSTSKRTSPSKTNTLRSVASTSRLGTLLAVSSEAKSEQQYNKPVGTGRPRRASLALNQHHNAEKASEKYGCVLHGDDCDGSVEETWLSDRAAGFVEPVPTVMGEGRRIMVDWARLLEEEKRKVG